jgi:hypothetical protein
MNQPNSADQVNPVLNVALWVFVASLAFLYVFIAFRGLNSPVAMDQAQIAREMAKGHGFTTQMIRPMAVQQAQGNGFEVSMAAMPDTFDAPLQPVVWAPVFAVLQTWWKFDRNTTVYQLDRVIACLGAGWLLLTLLLMHGIARRLFDRTLANFAVLALAMSSPLWEVVTTGGARAMLLFWVTAAAWSLTLLTRRDQAGEPSGILPLVLAVCCTAMVMTQWMAAWLVLGIVIAVALLLPGQRLTLFLVTLLPVVAVAGWLARNQMVCGDMLGAAKATLQSILMPQPQSVQMRDYMSTPPPLVLPGLLRKLNGNLSAQVEDLFANLLCVVPAALFFLALLHRFRRDEINKLRWAVGLMWLSGLIGMGFLGLPDQARDDNQMHAMLVPLMTVFGLAGLAVMWARLFPVKGGLWSSHGYALLAIAIGGWPMIMGLTTELRIGLFFKNQMMQPDYRAASISRLGDMVKPDEMLVSDAPWAVAWYADRPCLWLPKNRDQFVALREQAEKQKHHIAGFALTTICTKDTTFTTQFGGEYSEWIELVARGPIRGIGYDLAQNILWLREYPGAFPLGGMQLADGRWIYTMNFFADRDRWAALK